MSSWCSVVCHSSAKRNTRKLQEDIWCRKRYHKRRNVLFWSLWLEPSTFLSCCREFLIINLVFKFMKTWVHQIFHKGRYMKLIMINTGLVSKLIKRVELKTDIEYYFNGRNWNSQWREESRLMGLSIFCKCTKVLKSTKSLTKRRCKCSPLKKNWTKVVDLLEFVSRIVPIFLRWLVNSWVLYAIDRYVDR